MYQHINKSQVYESCRNSKTCSFAFPFTRPVNARYHVQPVYDNIDPVLGHKRLRDEGDVYQLDLKDDEGRYSKEEYSEGQENKESLNELKKGVNTVAIATENGVEEAVTGMIKMLDDVKVSNIIADLNFGQEEEQKLEDIKEEEKEEENEDEKGSKSSSDSDDSPKKKNS